MQIFRISYPTLGVQYAQRGAVLGKGERVVKQQADVSITGCVDRPESFGHRMRGVIERGGILGGQHDTMLSDSVNGCLAMGIEYNIHAYLWILKKTICPHRTGFRAAGLGDVGLGIAEKILGDRIKSLFKPNVIQTDRAELFLSPIGRLLRPHTRSESGWRFGAQHLLPLMTKRIQEDFLSDAVAPSCRIPHRLPVGRLVACADKTARIDKCLHHHRPHLVALIPVIGQTGQAQGQHMRGQVGNPHGGQDQKPIIADQPMQIGPARRFAPSDMLVPVGKRPCGRTKGQRAKIAQRGAFDYVSDLSSAQRAAAQVVVSIQQRKPNFGIFAVSAADRINRYGSYLLQAALNLGNSRFNPMGCRLFKAIGSVLPRQIENALVFKFAQCFAATHILKLAVWATPVQPLANSARQLHLRNRGFASQRLLYPIERVSRKMLSTYNHAITMASYTPCVKCVL